MSHRRRSTRRTVCQLAGGLIAGIVGIVSGESISAISETEQETDAAHRFDVYRGVVDRIVDGRFVVILLEEDGQVVDEVVVRRDEIPPVAESDTVIVILENGDVRCIVPITPP